MKNMGKLIFCSFIFIFYFIDSIDCFDHFHDRKAWKNACAQLPMNIDLDHHAAHQSAFMYCKNIGLDLDRAWNEFYQSLDATVALMIKKLEKQSLWTEPKPDGAFYDLSHNIFLPYAQKVLLQEGSRVIVHGDFHGDIHSFHAQLDQLEDQKIFKKDSFELADQNVYLLFLGDYVDRGHYGVEVIYTLLRLYRANPDNVIIVRGNHEDVKISNRYGFKDELIAKFGDDEEKYNAIYRLYNFLPIVAFIGYENDFLQCCHGGLEYGYNPQHLLQSAAHYDLIGTLQRSLFKNYLEASQSDCSCCCDELSSWHNYQAAFLDGIPQAPIFSFAQYPDQKETIGFMWADFIKFGHSMFSPRGLAANQDLTQVVLEYYNQDAVKKVRGIFRAHQHTNAMMQEQADNLMYELIASNGVYCMWRPIQTAQERYLIDGLVWTFNVAPDNKIMNKKIHYGFDAYAILTVAQDYQDWKLSVYNPMIINRPDYLQPQEN